MTTTTPARTGADADADAEFMDALLDCLIPASADGRMPGAGSLGIGAAVTNGIEGQPLVGATITAALARLREAALLEEPGGFGGLATARQRELVETHLATSTELMLAMLRHVYSAYYQDPRILRLIGEPARAPFPEGFTVEPIAPELMEGLRSRANPVGA